MENPTSILVLSGLPGVGKSTFVQSFIQECQRAEFDNLLKTQSISHILSSSDLAKSCLCLFIKHVSYDCIIPENIYSNSHEDVPLWKIFRRKVLNSIENDIRLLQAKNSAEEIVTNESADDGENQIGACVVERYNKFDWIKCSSRQDVLDQESTLYLFVIDDNMFYPSMRHEYYRLAQKYNVGFCQLHIHCSVTEAQRRNQARSAAVSMETINTMATKMTPPDASNKWEKYSETISSEDCYSTDNVVAVLSLALISALDPVPPVQPVDDGAIAADRQICSESLLHQADKILRKLIGKQMCLMPQDSSKTERRENAALLNETRKLILDELKSGSIEVSGEMLDSVTDASKDPLSTFHVLVEKSFKDKLK